jgi:CubicO group peptidase (beta-lactamase class C family)
MVLTPVHDPAAMPRTVAAIERGIADGEHLGAQLYVSHRGRVVADLALGEAKPGVPMTTDSLLLWMSSTKPVAAIAVAQQWEQGRLDLDDPVARHVPEFAAHGKEAITIRHVLTHTGGFRSAAFNWMDAPWDTQLARICHLRLEPRWRPGHKAGYHTSTGAFVLGEIVRRIDSRPFDRYLRESVFDPLQLTDAWVGLPPRRFEAYGDRISPLMNTDPHARQPAEFFAFLNTPQCAAVCRPSSGGWGPIRQLGRLYDALHRSGDGLLQPATVEAITQPARVGMFDHTFRHVMDWTLAFMLNSWHYGPDTCWYQFGPHASPRTVGHSGHQSSCAFADLDHGLTVAWACNGMPGEPRHRARWVAINTAIYEDLGLAAAHAAPSEPAGQ